MYAAAFDRMTELFATGHGTTSTHRQLIDEFGEDKATSLKNIQRRYNEWLAEGNGPGGRTYTAILADGTTVTLAAAWMGDSEFGVTLANANGDIVAVFPLSAAVFVAGGADVSKPT